MKKLLKRLAFFILRNDIKKHNEKVSSLKKYADKLEDAIVDDDVAVKMQAVFGAAARRNKNVEMKWGKGKQVSGEGDNWAAKPNDGSTPMFKVFEYPLEVSLTDK